MNGNLFCVIVGFCAFIVAFVLGSAITLTTGIPLAGGLLNGVLTSMVLTVGMLATPRNYKCPGTVMWLVFSAAAIVTTTLGPPGLYKPLIGLAAGITWDLCYRLTKNSRVGLYIGAVAGGLPRGVCAFVPQSPTDGLFGLPVFEELQTTSDAVDQQFLQSLVDLLHLTPFLSRFSHELSDGERMRTSIAATLAAKKDWLILDEWSTHLDSTWQSKIAQYLSQHVKTENIGTMEFVSSHPIGITTESLNLHLHVGASISCVTVTDLTDKHLEVAFGRGRGRYSPFEIRHSGRLHRSAFRKCVRRSSLQVK